MLGPKVSHHKKRIDDHQYGSGGHDIIVATHVQIVTLLLNRGPARFAKAVFIKVYFHFYGPDPTTFCSHKVTDPPLLFYLISCIFTPDTAQWRLTKWDQLAAVEVEVFHTNSSATPQAHSE